MAAHLEGKGASVLDFMGFAQKFGPVLSYIRIAATPADINQVRIEPARADALIGCDLVVSSSPKASITYRRGHTRAVLNTAEMATGDFVKHRDANLKADARTAAIRDATGELLPVDANDLANRLMGDTIYANVLLLGSAFQAGLVPVSEKALLRALELNGVKIEENRAAFAWGRIAAADSQRIDALLGQRGDPRDEPLDAMIERRAAFLEDYQDAQLRERYETLVSRVRAAEARVGGGDSLATTVAQAYFRLLSYKDEYEVARLHAETGFIENLRREYGAGAKLRFHLAPPVLNGRKDARGRPVKRDFGSWMLPVFRVLARMRTLRGGRFDIFGYTQERRMERALIGEFESAVDVLLDRLDACGLDQAVRILGLYLDIRGYGPVKAEAASRIRRQVEEQLAGVRRCADDAH